MLGELEHLKIETRLINENLVYLQQNKKGRRPKGKKCHTKTIRGVEKPIQLVNKRTPHVPLRQNAEE